MISIELKNLSKEYLLYRSQKHRLISTILPFATDKPDKKIVFSNINLSINKGEVVGILGSNGAGKSTLLKIIAGIMSPTTGTCNVHGSVSALLELGSGFNPEFTGIENLYFKAALLGFQKTDIDNKLEEIINFAGIGKYINQPLRLYSSGMKARLAFSLATALKPEVLILDEILSVGDSIFKKKSFQRMESLINGGATVLFVSHSEQQILEICNRAVFLNDGTIMMDGKPAEVVKEYQKLVLAKTIDDQINKLEDKSFDLRSFQNNLNFVFDHFCITDQKDNLIENLFKGEEYNFCFSFISPQDFECVELGVSIKNEKNLNLTGCKINRNTFLEAGKKYSIKFRSTIFLNPGSYFVNFSASSFINGEFKSLFAIFDAISFKVQAHINRDYINIGIYDSQFVACVVEEE